MTERICSVPECGKLPRNKTADLCGMHYHRLYRHGSVDALATEVSVSLGRRYRTQYRPDHPLAHKHGNVYVHRAALYDSIGPGPHSCHWCGTTVDWLPKGDPMALQVDHLNDDGSDNDLGNLVAACCRCNSARGAQRKADAVKAAGYWSEHDTVARTGGGRSARVA